MADVFKNIDAVSFRGVQFHVASNEWGFNHDLVQHKYPYRAVGAVEETGLNASQFNFQALFLNGLFGTSQIQYPDNFRAFVKATRDGTSGELVHPFLGKLKVKCESVRVQFDPKVRNGVTCQVSFLESPDDEEQITGLLGQGADLAYGSAAQADEDLSSYDLQKPAALSPNLLESLKGIAGSIDQFRRGVGNISSQIEAYTEALNELFDAVEALDDPGTWRINQSILEILDSLYRTAETVGIKSKTTTQVTVQRASNIASIAQFFAMTIADFLDLNPGVARNTTIESGTVVLIYA